MFTNYDRIGEGLPSLAVHVYKLRPNWRFRVKHIHDAMSVLVIKSYRSLCITRRFQFRQRTSSRSLVFPVSGPLGNMANYQFLWLIVLEWKELLVWKIKR